MELSFYKALEHRRSVYAIDDEQTLPADRIEEIIGQAMRYCPSAFDSRTSRVALLFGKEHAALWKIVLDALEPLTNPEKFPKTQEKIASFAAGYGTVLYFEDMEGVKKLQEQFPTYKDNFPVWSQQSSGMLQWIVWSALEMEGLGASLQHYNPLIDDAVRARWQLSPSWKLIAQMPFGRPTQWPQPREAVSLEERLHVFK